MNELNLTSIQGFLKDVEEKGECQILVEGQEKEEVFAIAKARGILVQNSIDLAAFKNVYAFSDIANNNGDVMVEDKVLKALPTLRGKPVNINHVEEKIVGYLIDYKYVKKEKKIIVYGILFKHAFASVFAKMKAEHKNKKLRTSYEFWTPKSQIRKTAEGLSYYGDLQFGGQAILFDKPPAFEGAEMLKISAECFNENVRVTASRDDYELITAEGMVMTKVTCKKCDHEFVPANEMQNELTCPNCKSVIDKEGNFLYPDQSKDYSVSCPNCQGSFQILEIKENSNIVRCTSCQQKYEIEFAEKDSQLDLLSFVRLEGHNCIQCGHRIPIRTNSKIVVHSIHCSECGIKYTIDLSRNKKLKIKNVKLLKEEKKIMSKLQAMFKVVAKAEDITEEMVTAFQAAPKEDVELISADTKQWVEDFIAKKTNKPVENKDLELVTAKLKTMTALAKKLVKQKRASKKAKVVAQSLTDETITGYEKELAELKEGSNKVVAELETKIETSKVENEKVVAMYKDNAQKIIARRSELGDFAKDMSDESILDEKEFEVVTLRKKVAELETKDPKKVTASDKVGDEPKDILVNAEKVEAAKKRDAAVKKYLTPAV